MKTLSKHRLSARLAVLTSALVVMTFTLVGTQLAGAAPAGAVTGIQKVTGAVSPTDSQSSKTAPPALCPSGKRVIGGGGWVFTTAVGANTVGLTELRPGQVVLVRFGRGDKGLMAAEIHPDIGTLPVSH